MKSGDTVTIFRQALGGRFCIEGRAKLVKPSDWSEDHWVVEFIEEGFSKRKVTRFVDESGQDNPEAHVDEMNRIVGFAEEAQ
jgi:hypothetical protein